MKIDGQCLRGSVRFHGTPVADRGVAACHCGQCRRWDGGGPFMAVRFEGGVTFASDETLTWFAASEYGERGFCSRCGSSLFWRAPGAGNDVAINASALKDGHGQEIFQHIWVDDQLGWYAFADDCLRLMAAQALGQAD